MTILTDYFLEPQDNLCRHGNKQPPKMLRQLIFDRDPFLSLDFLSQRRISTRYRDDCRPQASVYLRNDDCEVVRLAWLDVLDVRLGKDLVAVLDSHLLDIATTNVDIECGAPELASDLHGVPRAR